MASANINHIKSRLEWGQTAFTIIDVGDRFTYNQSHNNKCPTNSHRRLGKSGKNKF